MGCCLLFAAITDWQCLGHEPDNLYVFNSCGKRPKKCPVPVNSATPLGTMLLRSYSYILSKVIESNTNSFLQIYSSKKKYTVYIFFPRSAKCSLSLANTANRSEAGVERALEERLG